MTGLPQPSNHGWDNLPVEVIRLILGQLEGPSLLAVLQVNHLLHDLALEHFLGIRALQQLATNSQLILNDGHFSHRPRAICSALSLPTQLSLIAYSQTYHDLKDLLDDLHALYLLLKRVDNNGFKTLRLHLSIDCSCHFRGRYQSLQQRFTRLVDLALEKGCETMVIEKDILIPSASSHKRPLLSRIMKPLVGTSLVLASMLRIPMAMKKSVSTRLQSLTIADVDLFAHPLLEYSRDMAKTLTNLSSLEIRGKAPSIIGWQGEWVPFLASTLHLPSLTTFVLTGEDLILRPNILEGFLSRNSSIRELKLDVSFKYMSAADQIPRFIGSAILPHMELLSARPQLIAWLVQPHHRSPHNRKLYPSLRSVRILDPPRDRYPLVNNALIVDRAILSLNNLQYQPSRTNAGHNSPVSAKGTSLTLCIDLGADFWIDWLHRQVDVAFGNETSGGSRPENAGITQLVVKATGRLDLNPAPGDMMSILGKWLRTLPSLREIEVVGEFFLHRYPVRQRLCQEIFGYCPKLERLKYLDNLYFSRELR
ncbi:hypothetical protein NP233_g3701 [Leucocoprinus birnbaumii]|uniref:F-box domain-containing protein n=1 Tax=Leucocoprinus birnbaumii TaxID=56174 RepID=A0AAD5VYP6_9AGAR|nr:hypothetical protein NP233_g3701 [Leucocoprinus birnbaumii]